MTNSTRTAPLSLSLVLKFLMAMTSPLERCVGCIGTGADRVQWVIRTIPHPGRNGQVGPSTERGVKDQTGDQVDFPAPQPPKPPLIVDPSPAHIELAPAVLHFGTQTVTQALKVSNSGGTPATVALGTSDGWLSVPALAQQVMPGQEASYDVTVDRSGMAFGQNFSGQVLVQIDGETKMNVPVDGSKPFAQIIPAPDIKGVDYAAAVCGSGQGNFKTYSDIAVEVSNATAVTVSWTRGNLHGMKAATYDQVEGVWRATLGGFAAGLPVTFMVQAEGATGDDSAGPFQMQVKVC